MSKKKKKKTVKFKQVTITISARQKKSLMNFCKSRKSTPNKIIKKAIRPLLENYHDLEVNHVSSKVNQLQLFSME
ncbi:MAG: hypothetical protein NTY96_00875 [Bacteroidetes bacterium]|nr:hypothetical protein [Bacteroidota bacterium]